MKLTITINMDNDAFDNDAGLEVARILRHAANKIEDWPGANSFTIGLLDVNGNKVGNVTVK